jgi:hypothetical protein
MTSRQPLQPSWPGLTRPPSALASASACESSRRADARRLGGQLGLVLWPRFSRTRGAAHGDNMFVFKHLKFFAPTLFLLLNSFLYRADGPERPHAPRFPRHRGGAFARATVSTGGRGWRETRKSDEQFYYRRPACGRTSPQSQCAAPWSPFGGISREPQGAPRTAQGASPHARPRPCAWPTDARNHANAQCAARPISSPISSWPGSTRPPSALASASARNVIWRADARRMGGRLRAAHDEFADDEK